jgi:hypothetical protein
VTTQPERLAQCLGRGGNPRLEIGEQAFAMLVSELTLAESHSPARRTRSAQLSEWQAARSLAGEPLTITTPDGSTAELPPLTGADLTREAWEAEAMRDRTLYPRLLDHLTAVECLEAEMDRDLWLRPYPLVTLTFTPDPDHAGACRDTRDDDCQYFDGCDGCGYHFAPGDPVMEARDRSDVQHSDLDPWLHYCRDCVRAALDAMPTAVIAGPTPKPPPRDPSIWTRGEAMQAARKRAGFAL